MDTLKAFMYIVFFLLSVNAITWMLPYVGIELGYTWSYTGEDYANQLADAWGWSDNVFYDLGTGFLSMWLTAWPIVDSFPEMLANLGTPAFIYAPLTLIWRVLQLTAVALGIIAGRST